MASREMYTFDFSGLRVFLTGGGRGMGRGIAEAFAGWGATVGVTDIDEAGARATSEAIAAAGGRAMSHGVDVADDGSVDVALDAFLDFAGGIDLAINAAAVFSVCDVMEMESAEWRRVLDINTDYERPADVTRFRQRSGEPYPANHLINPPVVCNVMWAVSDFTKENGATRLVPGSQLSGRAPEPGRCYEVVHAEAPPGSIVVWEGRTWHGSGLNTGTAPRLGITMYWAAPLLRQLNNFTYGLRPEVVADLSDSERAVLGFKLWNDYGSTNDFDDEWEVDGEKKPQWASPGAESTGELNEHS